MTPPSYDGFGLVNVLAELEWRLTGSAASPRLGADLAASIPPARSYLVLLVDGLGADQLDHRAAATLAGSAVGVVDTGFPATTSVSLATLASGLPPRSHGVIGHLMWIPELGKVVNTLKWVSVDGRPTGYDTAALLPSPNLWERLAAAGVEAVTVQPGDFSGSPLTRALYRGARFEPTWSVDELVAAALDLVRAPGRIVFTYLSQVDFAAHVWGQASPEYTAALSLVDSAWSRLAAKLPGGAVLVGIADHGLIDHAETDKILVRDPRFDALTLFGDPRAVMARGEPDLIASLAAATGGTVVAGTELADLFGPPGNDHPSLAGRLPDAVVFAPTGKLILPKGFDRRLVGYHGGLDRRETRVPLLVAGGS